jgi:hypothetical protein
MLKTGLTFQLNETEFLNALYFKTCVLLLYMSTRRCNYKTPLRILNIPATKEIIFEHTTFLRGTG